MKPTMLSALHGRRFLWVWPVAVALALSACASRVKLDEPAADTSTSGSTVDVPARSGDGAAGVRPGESVVAPVTAGGASGKTPALADLPKVIYFDYDSYTVRPEAMPTVEGHAKWLQANRTQRMALEGHTDERGSREYNLALGQKRAEAVVRALTVLGVSAEQLEPVSMGEEKPASEGASEDAWAKNRRVEFKAR